MLALWGDAGVASAAATPLDTWKTWAPTSPRAGRFRAFSYRGKPDATAKALRGFFLTR